jgi:hypothetical protein
LLALEGRQLGLRGPGRFAGDELDPARRTARLAAARVQLIDLGVLLERQDQALPQRDVERSNRFHG